MTEGMNIPERKAILFAELAKPAASAQAMFFLYEKRRLSVLS